MPSRLPILPLASTTAGEAASPILTSRARYRSSARSLSNLFGFKCRPPASRVSPQVISLSLAVSCVAGEETD